MNASRGQMEAGGYEAMLHDMLKLDISTFNVRHVPVTEGLQRQRGLSLGVAEAWWKDCLERGYVFRSKLGLEEHFAEWHDTISTELLFASYMEFARERHERRPMDRAYLGRFMIKMGATPRRLSKSAIGEHLNDELDGYGIQHERDRREAIAAAEGAAETVREIWLAAVERRNAAAAAVEAAKKNATAHLISAAQGQPVGSAPSIKEARAALLEAEDDVEAAKAAVDAVQAEMSEGLQFRHLIGERTARAVAAVFRASPVPAALIADIRRRQNELMGVVGILNWLHSHGAVEPPKNALGNTPVESILHRHDRYFDSHDEEQMRERQIALAPFLTAWEALLTDPRATLPGGDV